MKQIPLGPLCAACMMQWLTLECDTQASRTSKFVHYTGSSSQGGQRRNVGRAHGDKIGFNIQQKVDKQQLDKYSTLTLFDMSNLVHSSRCYKDASTVALAYVHCYIHEICWLHRTTIGS
jgi:hypothetical protein